MLSQKKVYYKVFETNIEPMIRCMHIRKLNSCGWLKIPAGKYYDFGVNPNSPNQNNINICDISKYTSWINLSCVENNSIAKFIIASFDIECTSSDGGFPQPNRKDDKVIQIGTTFNRYGEKECFYRHIITLGTCDPIKGVDVESYETEKEVLLAWTRLLRRINPDIITGWNIFGFDYMYLHERSKLLGCKKQFSQLCRLNKVETPFIEKTLSSSALGDNMLRFYNMNGRVNIDLMKDVQRNFNLTSYKLDSVAAYFIREKINSIEKFNDGIDAVDSDLSVSEVEGYSIIKTGNIYGLKVGQYVTIYYNDGLSDNKFRDGKKFHILELNVFDNHSEIKISDVLDDKILERKDYKFFWCQAKDDVSPKDIFELQKGSSKDRAKIAKYCIQDCELCNKLMTKLQVVTNNVGMANVCSVPFSYIFLRGQGVKLFSLVSKKCRSKKFIMPVIKKKYNKDGDEIKEDGYEGAYVFDPIKGVYYVPIAVLDYASLYPRSMIHKNLSHESIVLDEKYNNLKGYIYHDVEYTNNDGSITKCRFAQKEDGSPGIIPEILNELLDARVKQKS